MATNVDLAILGAGPGGYVAAIRAAQLGMSVALIEKEKVGGICLHKGCIPSKTLLRSAQLYHEMKNSESYGIVTDKVHVDILKVQQRKEKIVSQLYKGVQHILKKNKVSIHKGTGRILGPSIFSPLSGTIAVEKEDGAEADIIIPKNVLIATGSRPHFMKGLSMDGSFLMTSDDALQMETLPTSLLIIGGGVIGIEWASMLNDFGVEVTIVESANRIFPSEDEDISKEMARLLKKRNVRILTNTKVLPEMITVTKKGVSIQANKDDQTIALSAERVLISIGRKANIEDIGLANTSIKVTDEVIQVNPFMQTAEPHIYAIGDVVGGYQLAHVAQYEGVVAVEHMAGIKTEPLDATMVPRCIYSRPEVASIGFTEIQAKNKGYEVKVGKFPFRSIGKALILGDVDGFIKIISDKETNDLLGIHIIGAQATDLISEAGLAKILNATAWEITQTIHPHPSLSEIYQECSLSVDGSSIHG